VQIYRFDPLTNLIENPEAEFRYERLRELADELPEKQAHVVSRVFFGGAPMKTAAAEIGVSAPTARQILEDALETLRNALQEED